LPLHLATHPFLLPSNIAGELARLVFLLVCFMFGARLGMVRLVALLRTSLTRQLRPLALRIGPRCFLGLRSSAGGPPLAALCTLAAFWFGRFG
jgi:hypothetical protein